jgi:PAS domain S-box-containing protein
MMPAPWKNRIGVKLFGILAVVIALAVFPFAYVVLVYVNSFGIYSANVNKEQIRQQAVSYLSRLSREQGSKYEEYFNRVNGAATLMSVQAREVYNNLEAYGGMAESPVELQWHEENEMFLTPQEQPILSLYWGGRTLTSEILLEARALTSLDQLMKRTKTLLPESLATHLISVSGIGRYYTWSEKGRDVARKLPKPSVFDLRDGAPLTLFNGAKRSTDNAQWTSIYKDDVIEGLMITASGPIVDNNGTLRAVVGIDLPLKTIVEDVIMESEISPAGKEILFSFLVDSTGQLIAFPDKYMGYFGFDYDLSRFKNSSDFLQYNLMDSGEEGVRSIVSEIVDADSTVQELMLKGEKHIVASQTLPSLGWKFALVTREIDLISSVQRTQNALRGTLKDLKREFVANSLVTVGLALLLVYLAVRYFVGPLQKLASIARQVGEGDLSVKCELKRRDELGALGMAMNNMIKKLAIADEMKSNYSSRLEKDIQERTGDLELKNWQLNKLVDDLHIESRERQTVTRALQESEEQLRSIMESSLAGLCIIQEGKFRYVNSAMADIFGYTRNELVDEISPADVIHEDYREMALDRIKKREAGQYIDISPYQIKCRARDGHIIDALIQGATTTWQGLPAAVGTIVDISRLKRVEDKLRINEKRLQASLEEKNVLLREVYHRTKNNMLVIISMLSLQMDGIDDQKARRVILETENRIRAMALVHEGLYRSRNLSEIDLGSYLENMVKTLVDSMTIGNRIGVTARCCQVSVPFDQAIPLGLVVNELVTNSVQHAFPNDGRGEVRLELRQDGAELQLTVADNGVGLPKNIDVLNSQSFGLQITGNLIEKQLRGSFAVNLDHGTEFSIRFTRMQVKKR